MQQWVQPAAVTIVVLYVVLQCRVEASPGRFLLRLFLTGASAFLAEESCIRLYRFYDYSDDWWVKLGHVPVLVLLIWPMVIDSATRLARQMRVSPNRPTLSIAGLALPVGLFVLLDAALIEPIAVHAGLWHWNEPGLFHVPPIGILGWVFYSTLCTAVFAWSKERQAVWGLLVVPVTVVGTHLLLLATWWGALRWVNVPLPSGVAAGIALGLSAALCVIFWRTRAGGRVAQRDLLMRIPAATFFGVLLLAHWPGLGALLGYFVAFTPPNIVLTLQARSSSLPTKESRND